MMRPITIKGDTTEKKFKHLEVILQRMIRRLNKVVVGIIPASPIFGYCEKPVNDSFIMRAIFPADGMITQAVVRADECSKDARIMVDIISGPDEITKSFLVSKKTKVLEVNYPVKAGDSLEAWVEDSNEKAYGFWLGFLYQVGRKDMLSMNIPIKQIEELLESKEDLSVE